MEQSVKKRIGVRKLTILLLLAARGADDADRTPISGTTRMQKLVFLAMEQSKEFLQQDEVFHFDFEFSADRFGPADLDLYQDLDLLKAAGWVEVNGETGIVKRATGRFLEEREGEGRRLLPEDHEEIEISFDYLMGEHSEEADMAEAERELEKEYGITDRGIARLEKIRKDSGKANEFDQLARVCVDVNREFGTWPLTTLLRYVYKTYPETTVRSEIKGQVLR